MTDENNMCGCCVEQKELLKNYNTQHKVVSNLIEFLKFIEENTVLAKLTEYDRCFVIVDRYLLAIAFKYIMMIDLEPILFTRLMILTALSIAHDVHEEANEPAKEDLLIFTLGPDYRRKALAEYSKSKLDFFNRMGQKGHVCKEWCDKLFELLPNHPLWKRIRMEGHGGSKKLNLTIEEDGRLNYVRETGKCVNCQTPEPASLWDI